MQTDADFDNDIRRWAGNKALVVHTPTQAQGPHHAWLIEGQKTRFIIGIDLPKDGELKAYAWLVQPDGQPGTSEAWIAKTGEVYFLLDNAYRRVCEWLA